MINLISEIFGVYIIIFYGILLKYSEDYFNKIIWISTIVGGILLIIK